MPPFLLCVDFVSGYWYNKYLVNKIGNCYENARLNYRKI